MLAILTSSWLSRVLPGCDGQAFTSPNRCKPAAVRINVHPSTTIFGGPPRSLHLYNKKLRILVRIHPVNKWEIRPLRSMYILVGSWNPIARWGAHVLHCWGPDLSLVYHLQAHLGAQWPARPQFYQKISFPFISFHFLLFPLIPVNFRQFPGIKGHERKSKEINGGSFFPRDPCERSRFALLRFSKVQI